MATMARLPRLAARSFAVYYGHGPAPDLPRADLLILEPAGWAPQDLRRLQATGPCCLAYLSALEASPAEADTAGLGATERLLWRPRYGNWVVDPGAAAWRLRLSRRIAALKAVGWDGLFIDTLGDVEDPDLAQQAGRLAPAAADLVRNLRDELGQGPMVMNNALLVMLPLVAPYLDGVCWESPPLGQRKAPPWIGAVTANLLRTAQAHGLLLLALTGGAEADPLPDPQAWADAAHALGFITYRAPGAYTLLDGGGAKPDQPL
jgi:hypothetical protein